MCGICGLVLTGEAWSPDYTRLLQRMTASLSHRGPDGEGTWIGGNAGLGHRRLAIIDLVTGDQPLTNENGSVVLVFNGEIYNFRELRRQLEARGHIFKTKSDTEVIVHLYEEKGIDCVQDLRGMFAFAIWDVPRQQLFLARDRVGKKPLFYARLENGFFFASEIKALLQNERLPRRLNPEALDDFLTYQYVPPPATIYEGIFKLPPAHTLVFSPQTGVMNVREYWHLRYEPKLQISEKEAIEQLLSILREAVKIRLESDVPLGAFLSGGIDSSTTVALMSELMDEPVRTFSIGFENEAFNELPYARIVAQRFRTNHREFIVRPKALAVLPQIVWHLDEPFGDSSALPTFYVAKICREHVKVALTGDGGDESFAGYERYVGNKIVKIYSKIPAFLRRQIIRQILAKLPEPLTQSPWVRRLRWLNQLSLAGSAHLYLQSMTIFNPEQRLRLYPAVLAETLRRRSAEEYMLRYYTAPEVREEIDRMLYSDVMTYLPGDLLVKVDRMAMAHGLETRCPFLDHKLMEYAASLPGNFKLRGVTLKYLLKRAALTLLPREVIFRPKQGFGVPLSQWFREELRPLLERTLGVSLLAADGYLRQEAISELVAEHVAGRANHGYRLWVLLVLELWYRIFLRNNYNGTTPPTWQDIER